MLIQLNPPIYTPPIHFKKIHMTMKNSGSFIRYSPLLRGDGTMFPLKNMLNIIFLKLQFPVPAFFSPATNPGRRGTQYHPK